MTVTRWEVGSIALHSFLLGPSPLLDPLFSARSERRQCVLRKFNIPSRDLVPAKWAEGMVSFEIPLHSSTSLSIYWSRNHKSLAVISGWLIFQGKFSIGNHDGEDSFSSLGEGNGNPLQCSCLENPRDRGAWWAAVYGVAQSRT